MKIEVEKYYRTKKGSKVYIGYRRDNKLFVGNLCYKSGDGITSYWTETGINHDCKDYSGEKYRNIVAEWEEQKEIDVANMWVCVWQNTEKDCLQRSAAMYTNMDAAYPIRSETIAFVTVKDWSDICAGKRNLLIGEGLGQNTI